jgi:hypothetical protein
VGLSGGDTGALRGWLWKNSRSRKGHYSVLVYRIISLDLAHHGRRLRSSVSFILLQRYDRADITLMAYFCMFAIIICDEDDFKSESEKNCLSEKANRNL